MVIFTRYLRFLALDNGVSVHMIMVTIKCGQIRDHLETMTTVYTLHTSHWTWSLSCSTEQILRKAELFLREIIFQELGIEYWEIDVYYI